MLGALGALGDVEGSSPVPFKLGTIPSGDAGVAATLRLMVDMVLQYRAAPVVRLTAQRLVSGCAERDRACHVRTLQGWVRDSITYLPDVRDVETLQTPDLTLSMGSGDCDDKAILLASLLESIGFPTRFCAVGVRGGPFSHVSAQAMLGKGWLNLETIVPGVAAGWFPPDASCLMLAHVR